MGYGLAGLHLPASLARLASMGLELRNIRPSITGFAGSIDAQSLSICAALIPYPCLWYGATLAAWPAKQSRGSVAIFFYQNGVSPASCRATAARPLRRLCSATTAGSLLCLPGGTAARRPTASAGQSRGLSVGHC